MPEQPSSTPRYERQWLGQGRAGKTGGGVVSRRTRQIFFVLLGMGAIAGAIVAILHRVSHNPVETPYFLSIAVTQYRNAAYPDNPLAIQDSDVLIRRFPGGERAAVKEETGASLLASLDQLKGKKEQPVVVHLTALALYWGGSVFILPARAEPDKSTNWVKLRDVLDRIGSCPSQHKLLILDIMAPLADPRLGVLANNVADHVQDELDDLQRADKLPFFVLCACSRGQLSHPMEEEGQTALGYYLDEGLRGYADSFGEGAADGKITVQKLANFVRVRVQRWARTARDRDQTPVLRGTADDFGLAFIGAKKDRGEPPFQLPQDYPDWLRQPWKQRDSFLDNRDYLVAPRLVREMEARLLQAEQQWQAGRAPEGVDGIRANRLQPFETYADKIKGLRGSSGPGMRQLAVFKPDETTLKTFKGVLRGYDDLMDELAEQARKAEKELTSEKLAERLKELAGLRNKGLEKLNADIKKALEVKPPPPELVAAFFDALREDLRLTPDKLKDLELGNRTQGLQKDGNSQFVEVQFLRLLTDANLVERWTKGSQSEVARSIHLALEAVHESELIVAAYEPRVLPWVGEKLKEADTVRRTEVQKLLNPQPGDVGSLVRDAQPLTEQLKKTGIKYREVRAAMDKIKKAYQTYDEAFILLPMYYSWLVEQGGSASRQQEAWQKALEAMKELRIALAVPAAPSLVQLDKLADTADKLWRLVHEDLDQPFDPAEVKDLAGKAESGSAQDYQKMQLRLGSSRLDAANRATLWAAARSLARNLHAKVLKLDQEQDDTGKQKTSSNVSANADRAELERARRRRDLTLDLLRLSGYFEYSGEAEPKVEADAGSETDADLHELGDKLRELFSEKLPVLFASKQETIRQLSDASPQKEPELKQELAAADRLSRALYPLGIQKDRDANERFAHPAAELRRLEARWRCRYLENRYAAEADAVPTTQRLQRDFFSDLAKQYKECAR